MTTAHSSPLPPIPSTISIPTFKVTSTPTGNITIPSALPFYYAAVLAPWRIESQSAVLCDWNVEGGARGRIGELAKVLLGKRVVAAATRPPGWDLRLDFETGVALLVFGDATVDRDDAWFILGTDGAEGAGAPVWAVDS